MNGKTVFGAWGIQILIRSLTIVLGLVIFWLLGFVMYDIVSIQGPDYNQIERKHVEFNLIQRQGDLQRSIANLEREILAKQEQQTLAGSRSDNLQHTINQLVELQRVSLEKQTPLPESGNAELSSSLAHFLESQKGYQALNQEITVLVEKKNSLDEEKRKLDEEIEEKRKPAQKEYDDLLRRHRLLLACIQLAILLPLLFAAGYVLMRWRGTIYYPLLLAFGGATLVRTGIVIHEYFPSRYFKYLFTIGLLLVVGQILIHLIRQVAYPKATWLAKHYREAYERFLCPICNYPIRTGPRKYLYWTRRTVHKVLPQGDPAFTETPYTCPSCGTTLFEICEHCQKVRHSLLNHCEHCGAEKTIA